MDAHVPCPRCRTGNDAGASFCSSCGAALAATSEPVPASAPSGWALATAGMDKPAQAPASTIRYAGWLRRFGAFLLDGIILFLTFLAFSFVFGAILGVANPDHWLVQQRTTTDAANAQAVFSGIYVVFFAIWEVAWIASAARGKPGQRILGFVVAKPDGSRVSTANAIGRFFSKLLLFAMPLVNFVLLIVTAVRIGTSEQKVALHDSMAGTICMRTGGGVDVLDTSMQQHVATAPNRATTEPAGVGAPPASSPPPLPPSPPSSNSGPFV